MDFIKKIIEGMKEEEEHDNTISGHYGITKEQYNNHVKEILCDLIKTEAKSTVLDKHFPKLDAEGRAKVHAYAAAMYMFDNIKTL